MCLSFCKCKVVKCQKVYACSGVRQITHQGCASGVGDGLRRLSHASSRHDVNVLNARLMGSSGCQALGYSFYVRYYGGTGIRYFVGHGIACDCKWKRGSEIVGRDYKSKAFYAILCAA